MTTNDVTTPTGDELLAGIGQLTIVYEDAGDGWYTVYLLELPSAISQGKTLDEARANVLDAAKAVLLSHQEDGTDPEVRAIAGTEVLQPTARR